MIKLLANYKSDADDRIIIEFEINETVFDLSIPTYEYSIAHKDHPDEHIREIDLDGARYFINNKGVPEEDFYGNLTQDEIEWLCDVIDGHY